MCIQILKEQRGSCIRQASAIHLGLCGHRMTDPAESPVPTECLRVVVRCRPPSAVETRHSCVLVDEACAQVVVQQADKAEPPRVFTYDAVLGSESTQEQASAQGKQ